MMKKMYVGGNIVGENEDSKKEICFVIMPISDQGDYPEGHFKKVYEQIFKPAIEVAGYEAFRVDENKMCDSIMKKYLMLYIIVQWHFAI